MFLDIVTAHLDNNNCVDVTFLDFAKAFKQISTSQMIIRKIARHRTEGEVWG